MADYQRPENCPSCGTLGERIIKPKIHLYGTAVQDAYFSQALGKVVKGNTDERRQAKDKGWIELGNDKPTWKPQIKPYDI